MYILCVAQIVSPAVMVEVESSGLVVREGSDVIVLTCEVYGYSQNSSPPKCSSPGRDLETGRFNTTLSNTGLLTDGSVSSTEKVVVSQLTIYYASGTDEGNYTCSVDGQSATITLTITNGWLTARSNINKKTTFFKLCRKKFQDL